MKYFQGFMEKKNLLKSGGGPKILVQLAGLVPSIMFLHIGFWFVVVKEDGTLPAQVREYPLRSKIP